MTIEVKEDKGFPIHQVFWLSRSKGFECLVATYNRVRNTLSFNPRIEVNLDEVTDIGGICVSIRDKYKDFSEDDLRKLN